MKAKLILSAVSNYFAISLCMSCQLPPAFCAETVSSQDMLRYLVQSVRIDSRGRSITGIPIPGVATRMQRGSDPAFYRKHDWPDILNLQAAAKGYQASDSVLDSKGQHWLMVQTFDFGDGERKFGVFDGKGDGGQIVGLIGGVASAYMTEDGGDGIQWFIGPGSRSQVPGDRKFISWILFAYDVNSERWTDVVAHLNKTRSANERPRNFGAAYTRYRLAGIDVPFRFTEGSDSGKPREVLQRLPVIVSEHYGGGSITTANHLERFFFARDFGLIRWERWENKTFSKQPNIDKTADAFATSGRVPPIAFSVAPGPTWRMMDSRTWTNIVAMDGSWKVDDYKWPEQSVLDQL